MEKAETFLTRSTAALFVVEVSDAERLQCLPQARSEAAKGDERVLDWEPRGLQSAFSYGER